MGVSLLWKLSKAVQSLCKLFPVIYLEIDEDLALSPEVIGSPCLLVSICRAICCQELSGSGESSLEKSLVLGLGTLWVPGHACFMYVLVRSDQKKTSLDFPSTPQILSPTKKEKSLLS